MNINIVLWARALASIVSVALGIYVATTKNKSKSAEPIADHELDTTLYLWAVQNSGSNLIWDAGSSKFFAEKVENHNGYLCAITNNEVIHSFAPGSYLGDSRIGGPFTTENQVKEILKIIKDL